MSGLSGCALKPEAFRDVVQSALQILTSSRSSSSFESETRASGHEAEVLRILALAAYERWSESQCKQACATVALPPALAEVLVHEWSVQGRQVIAALENGSLWQSTPQLASWRVDMVTAAKADAAEGLAEPIALFEIQAKQRHGSDSSSGALRWEANKEQLQQLLQACEEIEGAIAASAE